MEVHDFFFILISDENEKSDELEYNIEEDNCNVNYENYEDSLPGSNDIALWPSNLSDRKIDYLVKFIPHSVGDISSLKIEYTDRNRTYMRNFHTSDFYCTKANGKKEKREWLIYSETSRKIYCFVCKLFSKSSNKLITGYNSWKNISRDLKDHECSKEHISSMCRFKIRSSVTGRVDSSLAEKCEMEENYWREILKRIVATVKLLASLGIAFRGHREGEDSERKGNYLTCIEYLAQFDSFFKNHLERFSNTGKGHVNYLSHHVCEEFIQIMSEKVTNHLIAQVKEAMYYSIIVDSTPDVSHVDQLTVILRFVNTAGEIKECFFGFVSIEHHDGAYLAKIITDVLNTFKIDLTKCRGQSYDNASNMSGKYSGLQTRLKEHSPNAVYIPCASHSLNLVGNCAAESCSVAIRFFDFVQNLFVFFSGSTRRWKTLTDILPKKSPNMKRICDTRWSARADAVSALKKNYGSIKEALTAVTNSTHEKPIGIIEAQKLLKSFYEYEIALLTVMWEKLLQRIDITSKSLQDTHTNLFNGVALLKSLKDHIMHTRNNFEIIEEEAGTLTESRTFQDERNRTRKRKIPFDESVENDTILCGRKSFIVNVFYVVCDVLIVEMEKRAEAYNSILAHFKFIFDTNISTVERDLCIDRLLELYKEDIDTSLFKEEFIQFQSFAKEMKLSNPEDMYKLIIDGLSSTFPNVETILKIFLTIPICNASGERSFSVLKRIKNYQRNSLSQENLKSLSVLFIEREVMEKLNFDDVIDDFAKRKSRKVHI